jgi:outer membrane protein TolC
MLSSAMLALIAVEIASSGEAAPAPSPEATTLSLEDALRLGDQQSPLLRRARAEAHIVRAREVGASLVLPSNPLVALIVELERDLPGQIFIGGGIALPLPTWRRNQGERALVAASKDRVAQEQALVDREIALQVEHAYQRVISTYEQAKVLETRVAPAAETGVNLLTDGWRAGKFDLFRVIQASREAGEAYRAQLEAVRDFWEAIIDLDRATGAV